MVAMFILCAAILPIYGLLTQDVKETDFLIAHSYAIDHARQILGTLLSDVAFADLVPGNPGALIGSSSSLGAKLFPGATAVIGGFACQGIASDSRGIRYSLYLRVESVEDTTTSYNNGDLSFSFYPTPRFQQHPEWPKIVNLATQTEMTGNAPSMFYKGGAMNPGNAPSPYRFFDVTGITSNLWGPEEEALNGPQRFDQTMISQPVTSGHWCVMKRIVLQIRWNLVQAFYSNPTTNSGRPQMLNVITYKANLDS